MGKGDKKTKRGKIVIGSSGVTRQRKKKNSISIKPAPPVVEPPKKAKSPSKKSAQKTEE